MPSSPSTPFVLGGRVRLGFGGLSWPGRAALTLLAIVLIAPLRGLYKATGSSMEEGFMLVFPNLVQNGWVPNADFLHLYGPASLDALALWYRIFGDSLGAERTFGLMQNLAIVGAIYALARVRGHVAAVGAALVATMFVMTPIGLTALAWHGGVALGLWAVVFGARARSTGSPGDWWIGAGLAGLALAFRPDLVIALGLAFVGLLWGRRREAVIAAAGLMVGLLPMWWHLARAGLVTAFEGMVIDPVARLRPGRELPRPPSWNRLDGALQAVAESLPPWWRLPAPAASHQLFLWFWLVIAASVGLVIWTLVRFRRADPGERADLLPLMAGALFGLGILPQALQRPDSTHLAWVAMVSWPLFVPMLAPTLERRWHRTAAADRGDRRPRRSAELAAVGATALVGVVMIIVCPFFTYRTYLLHTRVSVGNLPAPFEIEREGRRFWVGDPAVASAVTQMMPDLEARMQPGDTLIVGPGDLSRTVYADTYIYWLFSELVPGTAYIEMDPGLADAEESGLAEDIADADFVVLTNTWSGWYEPNASMDTGSPEHNQAVADHHCLVGSYETNLVLLFESCEGGGGFNPVTVAGRAPGIAGGGIDPAD